MNNSWTTEERKLFHRVLVGTGRWIYTTDGEKLDKLLDEGRESLGRVLTFIWRGENE